MTWLRKSKTVSSRLFRELTARGLCDIHSHILPGLDDGAKDVRESLVMLEGMARLGYSRVVATPHFIAENQYPGEQIQNELIDELVQSGSLPSLTLHTGAEIAFHDQFLSREKEGYWPRIGPERTYLIEFGFTPGCLPLGIEDLLFRFRARGGNLIIAHPERVPEFQSQIGKLERIRQMGTLLQVDLTSLSGKYGKKPERAARAILEEGLADIVASDIHRPQDLGAIESALLDLANWDADALARLASTNPHLVVDGRFDEVQQDV